MRSRCSAFLMAALVALPALHASVMYSFTGAQSLAGTTFALTTPDYLSLSTPSSLTPTSGELVINGNDYGVLTSVALANVTFPVLQTGFLLAHDTPYTGIGVTVLFNYNIAQDGVYSDTLGQLTIQSTPAVTPEPSSLLLLGTGVLSAMSVARRRVAK